MHQRLLSFLFFSFFVLMFLSSIVSFSYAGQLVYSTYLGGSGDDYGYGIAVDASGNAYITGYTDSSDFPRTSGAWDTSYSSSIDVFVTKLNPSGTGLVYSTYLGGLNPDYGMGIAVDTSSNAYITGYTWSNDFPTTVGAWDNTSNGFIDVFVSKLNPSGTGLVYSTYLGGSGRDFGYGIALDSSGNAFLTGETESSDFPTTVGALDTSWNGSYDGFVSKLNPSGTDLVYSTYLGGTDSDVGYGIAVDVSDNAYITGETYSSNFPMTAGAYDTIFNGYTNATADSFVSKLNPSGTGLVYSTYLGGSNNDYGYGIAVDASGNAYITGYTNSSDFPTTSSAWDTSYHGYEDGFVSKLNPGGTGLVYSTYLGGNSSDRGHDIAVDTSGNAYITGDTWSSDFPTTSGAWDTNFNNNADVFVSKLNPGGTRLVYSTYIGGSSSDYGHGIAVDSAGNAYITGYTGSTDVPTTTDAYDTTFNGGYNDVFVTKLSLGYYVSDIPDIKLLKEKSQSDVIKLNDYLVNTTSASWSWSSQSTFAYLSIDSNSWVDYLIPKAFGTGEDTVTFWGNGVVNANSVLKYSSYLLKRLPDATVDNGQKVLNCEIPLQNYIMKDISIGYPNSYPYEVRYSNSTDSGKLTVTFSGNTIKINPSNALLGSADVVVTATPGAVEDWDKEFVHVAEVLNSNSDFSLASDTAQYWYTLPVVGASSLPTVSWMSSIGGRNGVLQVTFTTATQGVKIVFNQELNIKPFTWYTLRCLFASGAGTGNQHIASGQLFGVDTVTNIIEVGSFLRQPGQLRDTTWWGQQAYIYSSSNTMIKVRPMLVVKNNGSRGNFYIDYLRVYENRPMTERAYGVLSKSSLANGRFNSGLSGWFYGYPAMGINPAAPLPGYSVVSSFNEQNNVLQLSFTQVKQGLKLTSDPVVNLIPLKSTRLSWKVYGVANNPNRSVSGRIYCIDTASALGGLSDVLGPSGVNASMPNGEWLSYTAVGSPVVNSETQARVQLVIKNGNTASDTVYLDDIVLEQENDSPYYWDHTLY